jgi:hypothetical protein
MRMRAVKVRMQCLLQGCYTVIWEGDEVWLQAVQMRKLRLILCWIE